MKTILYVSAFLIVMFMTGCNPAIKTCPMFGIGDKVIVTSMDCSENIGIITRGPVPTYNDGWYYHVYARNTSIYISETSIQLQQRINWDEKPGVKEYILRVYEEPELAPAKPYDPFDNNSIIKPTDKTI